MKCRHLSTNMNCYYFINDLNRFTELTVALQPVKVRYTYSIGKIWKVNLTNKNINKIY